MPTDYWCWVKPESSTLVTRKPRGKQPSGQAWAQRRVKHMRATLLEATNWPAGMPKLAGLRALLDCQVRGMLRAEPSQDGPRFFITDRGRAWLSE
jgi:hypothetical protein